MKSSQYGSYRKGSEDDEKDRKPAAKFLKDAASANVDDIPQSGATSLASSTAVATEYSYGRRESGRNQSFNRITKESSAMKLRNGPNTVTRSPATTATTATLDLSLLSRFQWTMGFYVLSTSLASGVFVVHILPTEAVWALFWILVSTFLMLHSLIATLQRWYQDVVVLGPGLGSFIPEAFLTMMTQTTLHEMLTDETLVLEYRHLLLYFLPLSNDQLNLMIQRLAPQHRQRLYRRGGIGQMMLGESFMRILLGNAQYDQWRQLEMEPLEQISNGVNYSIFREPVAAIPTVLPQQQQQSFLLIDDEGSDLGLDVSSEDLIGGDQAMAQRLGLVDVNASETYVSQSGPPNEVVTTVRPDIYEDNDANRYNDQEFQVLVDALMESMNGFFVNPIQAYVSTSYMLPAMQGLTRHSFRTGLALLSFSMGNWMGLWTWSYSILYDMFESTRYRVSMIPLLPHSLQPSIQRDGIVNSWTPVDGHWFHHPSTTTWSTALLGSASIGISYYSRQWVRRHMLSRSPSGNFNGNRTPPKLAAKSLSQLKDTP